MKLFLVAAALAVASCASISLEDLEFHAWKLKFGEIILSDLFFFYVVCCQIQYSSVYWENTAYEVYTYLECTCVLIYTHKGLK